MIRKQIAIIGLGKFGSSLAMSLVDMGCEVIGIDKDEEKVRAVANRIKLAVSMDALDPQALKDIGLRNVDAVVVSIGENIEANILIVMLLKKQGITNIVAKAVSELHASVLEQMDIGWVVFPERDMAVRIAKNIVQPDVMESISLSSDYSIVEMPAPMSKWNQTLIESNLRSQFSLSVIAIRPKQSEDLHINPSPQTMIKRGDLLVLLGKNTDIDLFRENCP